MRLRSALEQRLAEPRYRVHICHGPNCTPRGSRSLVGELERLLAEVGISGEIEIIATSCRNRCEIGPSVNVYPGPYFYREVTPAVLSRIVREHLLGDQPVSEYLVEVEAPRIDLSALKFDF